MSLFCVWNKVQEDTAWADQAADTMNPYPAMIWAPSQPFL